MYTFYTKAHVTFIYTCKRKIKARAEIKTDIILMDFCKILCIGFKQQTVCTQLFSQCCQEVCVFCHFTHNCSLQYVIHLVGLRGVARQAVVVVHLAFIVSNLKIFLFYDSFFLIKIVFTKRWWCTRTTVHA